MLRQSGLRIVAILCGVIELASIANAGRRDDESKSDIDPGNAAMDKRDSAGAIEAYGRAVALVPKSAVANFNRGYARQMKGDLEGALADYNFAISLDSKRCEIFANRANVRQLMGDFTGAIEDYNRSLRLNSRSPKTWYNRGRLWLLLEENDRAITDFDQAIRIDPGYSLAYNNRGVGSTTEGKPRRSCCRLHAGPYDKSAPVERQCKPRLSLLVAWQTGGSGKGLSEGASARP